MSETTPEISPATDEHIYLTLDEEDRNLVLELVRVAGEEMFVREDEEWISINPDEDNPRVWDRQIIDVTPEAASVFDQAEQTGTITRDLFASVEIPDEDSDGSDSSD